MSTDHKMLTLMPKQSEQWCKLHANTPKKLFHLKHISARKTMRHFFGGKKLFLLIELCPLRELRRLSTEPPAFSFGFSRESMSGWGD